MPPLYIISALVATYICFVQGQQGACITPNNAAGECKLIYDCPPLLAILEKARTNQSAEETALLRNSFCGFIGNMPKVCCPLEQRPIIPDRRCFTYDGKEGTCIGLYSCPQMKNLLTPPITRENLSYVQNSRCESPDKYSVCCGPDEVVPPSPGPLRTCSVTAAPPDPRTECCGFESGGGNRIFGGNVTAIDQFPWLALIEYRGVRDDRIKLLCGGALISSMYVLTAGHCVTGSVLNVGTPINVRLGEYDVAQTGRDCVTVEGGGTDCADEMVTIAIEKTIPHRDYNPTAKLRRNDIALIRLKTPAPYTDFIRPICLPTSDITLNPPAGIKLQASGWGAVSDTQSFSNVKLYVELPLATKAQCEPYYQQREVPLWSGQLCAGGEKGKDSCKGDSGGPLMRENGRVWEVVGVVSFGPTPCGMENIPGVYTKVFEYLPWLRTEMKP